MHVVIPLLPAVLPSITRQVRALVCAALVPYSASLVLAQSTELPSSLLLVPQQAFLIAGSAADAHLVAFSLGGFLASLGTLETPCPLVADPPAEGLFAVTEARLGVFSTSLSFLPLPVLLPPASAPDDLPDTHDCDVLANLGVVENYLAGVGAQAQALMDSMEHTVAEAQLIYCEYLEALELGDTDVPPSLSLPDPEEVCVESFIQSVEPGCNAIGLAFGSGIAGCTSCVQALEELPFRLDSLSYGLADCQELRDRMAAGLVCLIKLIQEMFSLSAADKDKLSHAAQERMECLEETLAIAEEVFERIQLLMVKCEASTIHENCDCTILPQPFTSPPPSGAVVLSRDRLPLARLIAAFVLEASLTADRERRADLLQVALRLGLRRRLDHYLFQASGVSTQYVALPAREAGAPRDQLPPIVMLSAISAADRRLPAQNTSDLALLHQGLRAFSEHLCFPERCDGRDNDCDGRNDEDCRERGE